MLLKRAIILSTSVSLLLSQQVANAEQPLWWKVGVVADQMYEESPVEAIKYYKKAVAEAKSAAVDPRVLAAQIYALGKAQYLEGDLADAIQTFKTGVNLAVEHKLNSWHASFLLNIGLCKKFQIVYGILNKAEPTEVLQALKIRPGSPDAPSDFRINCYEALADIYRSQKDYASAENYVKLAINECEMAGDEDYHIADFTVAQSLLRYQQGKREEAKSLLALACKIHPAQSGHYQTQYIELANEDNKDDRAIEESARSLIEKRDYAGLEKLANSIRLKQLVDSSGYLRIHHLYDACGLDNLSEDETEKRISNVRLWVQKYPQSPTARIALATILIDYAWQARGTGYSNTVSREGWKLFEQRLKDAWAQLESVKKRPADWYRWALKVGLGQSWSNERYDQVYNECRKRFPKLDEVIWARANRLLPKWHGKLGDSEALLNAELRKRSGADADVFYAQTVLFMTDISNLESFDWQRMRRGFEEIIRRYPRDGGMKACYFAWAIGNNDSATLLALGVKSDCLPPPAVHDASKVRPDFHLAELEKRRVSESDLERYTRVINETPDSWEGYYDRGQCYSKEDKREEAINDFSKAIELSPKYSGQALIARCGMYKMIAQYDKALADAETFQRQYPKSPAGFRNHGEVFSAMENYRGAIEDINRCLEISPGDLTALETLTRTYDEFGNLSKAIEVGTSYLFQEGQKDRDSVYFSLQDRALAYIHAGEYDLAMEDLKWAMVVNPKHSQLWAYLGLAFAMKNDVPKAVEAMRFCERLDTFAPRATRLRAEVYRAAGKWQDALVDYEKSTSMEPDFGPGFMQKAITEIALGEYDDAAEDLKKAIKRVPASAQSHALLALVEELLGNKDEAEKLITKAFDLTPGFAPNYLARGRIRLHQSDFVQAAADCQSALDANPFLADSYELASEIYDSCGNEAESKKFLDLAHSMGWRDLKKDFGKPSAKAVSTIKINVPAKPDLKAAVAEGMRIAGEGAPDN